MKKFNIKGKDIHLSNIKMKNDHLVLFDIGFEKIDYKNDIEEIYNKYSINNLHHSRKYNEIDYFKAYIHFLNNNIYYSRYTYVNQLNTIIIRGKYLNEKVNIWNSDEEFNYIDTL